MQCFLNYFLQKEQSLLCAHKNIPAALQISITLGNPAIFNASITYTPGGSCDFKQTIKRVKLT